MATAGQEHLYDKVELAGDSIDALSGGLIVISEPHALLHAGKVFHMSQKVTGITNGATVSFSLVVPAATYPHIHKMRATVGAGDVDIIAYENSILSADGTPLSTDNLDRNSSNTAGMTINSAPTITDVGDQIHTLWIPPTATGNGQSVTGVSDANAGEEWILKPSTKYVQQITNNSGGTISAWVEIMFYEI